MDATPFGGPPRLLGTRSRGKRFKCGGWTECEELHEFFEPHEILVLTEAQPLADLREDPHWNEAKLDKALKRGTLYASENYVVPTLLGDWWEDASVN